MDKFALFRFPDESLAVESVTFIKDYDPVVKHNSKTWPEFLGPTQKGNWVKVNWPNEDKNKKATGTTKLIPAQLVKLSPIRSELEKLLEKMLKENREDRGTTKTLRLRKRKAVEVEERALQQLRQDFNKKVIDEPSDLESDFEEEAMVAQVEATSARGEAAAAKAEASAANTRAAEAETRAADAEARAADAEARAADAEARAADAEARAAEAEARAGLAEERVEMLEARADDAETRASVAESKALFAVDSLYPFMEGMPALFADIKSYIVNRPAGENAAAGAGGASIQFGTTAIPTIRLLRLSSTPSLYIQELAQMVFGNEMLGKCCLKGSVGGSGKPALNKETVDDIIGMLHSSYALKTNHHVLKTNGAETPG